MCEAVQSAIGKAWHRISRYHFYLAACTYFFLVALVSAWGAILPEPYGFHVQVRASLAPQPASSFSRLPSRTPLHP